MHSVMPRFRDTHACLYFHVHILEDCVNAKEDTASMEAAASHAGMREEQGRWMKAGVNLHHQDLPALPWKTRGKGLMVSAKPWEAQGIYSVDKGDGLIGKHAGGGGGGSIF